MIEYKFSVSLLIPSPPQTVYNIIADYREGHPKILPDPPFVSLDIDKGGFGNGTVLRVKMKVFGKLQEFKTVVTEPEPGHILVETNDTGYITTFTVDPRENGKQCFVTFTTEISKNSGVAKKIEFFFSRMFLPLVYKKELENLSQAADAGF
jgi:hypothetical protein